MPTNPAATTPAATTPVLVVLAAGLGRRFGGLKQLAPIGPAGEALLDLTVADAAAAGFGHALLVVRPEIRAEVLDHARRRAAIPVEAVEQGPEGPAQRARPRSGAPWGTTEAVAVAAAKAGGPFAVANADDAYGADAIAALGRWFTSGRCRPGRAALVTYPLEATVPREGAVTRAVCRIADATVAHTVEHHDVHREVAGSAALMSDHGVLESDLPVSMNLWGFDPSVGPALADAAAAFAADHDDPKSELPLPTAIDVEIRAGRLTVEAIAAGTTWYGVTHPGDLTDARRRAAGAPETT